MTALRNPILPDGIRNELARLVRAGFPLLPLGGGEDGKAPLLRAWSGPALGLGRILAPMHRTGSLVYGVRLDGLAVIDCDTDSAELVSAMEARFGPSPVHVKTPRGRHLYYRAAGNAPNLRGEGLPVDIKTGARSYVVGPLSQRLDGGLYIPAKGLLGTDGLPLLRAPQAPVRGDLQGMEAGAITVGHRHAALVREAVRMIEYVDSAEELASNLAAVRKAYARMPRPCPTANCARLPIGHGRRDLKTACIMAATAPFRCIGWPWMPCAVCRMMPMPLRFMCC